MRNKYLFWTTLAIVVGRAVAILVIMSRDKSDQPYTTEVSVKSGTVEVQTDEGTTRLKPGEKVVVGKGKQSVRIKKPVAAQPGQSAAITANGKIAGVVVDSKGDPIENAALLAIMHKKGTGGITYTAVRDGAGVVISHLDEYDSIVYAALKDGPRVVSDTDGAFEVTGLETRGRYDFIVGAPGYEEAIKKDLDVGSDDVGIILQNERILS